MYQHAWLLWPLVPVVFQVLPAAAVFALCGLCCWHPLDMPEASVWESSEVGASDVSEVCASDVSEVGASDVSKVGALDVAEVGALDVAEVSTSGIEGAGGSWRRRST